ncbi:MAG: hypothetical protein GF317_10635 [Candidatus Lokiarchaeota archaeon]|nr:hypothetical protein [Candidatus Lokiarchaeota archaeon]MBD3200117.1 hypothetical protein [Candidatus Lokiarchaeota archaeon]
MAKKKNIKEEIDEIPKGKVDEDGDEILDLYEEKDNLDDDYDLNLDEIDDEMLADEDEDEEFGPEVDEVQKMLRKIKCEPCLGSSSKASCKVRDDFGCPPDKANK